jgi:hypothetical protein
MEVINSRLLKVRATMRTLYNLDENDPLSTLSCELMTDAHRMALPGDLDAYGNGRSGMLTAGRRVRQGMILGQIPKLRPKRRASRICLRLLSEMT